MVIVIVYSDKPFSISFLEQVFGWLVSESNFYIEQTMVAKTRQNTTDSPTPKPGIGEIDTSPPFQSVKDAVTLFGEGAFSGEKPAIRKAKPYSAEVIVVLYLYAL